MNEEDFIREMNDQDMDNDQYDDIYEVDIDYTTQSWDQTKLLKIYMKVKQPKKVEVKPIRKHYNAHLFGWNLTYYTLSSD